MDINISCYLLVVCCLLVRQFLFFIDSENSKYYDL